MTEVPRDSTSPPRKKWTDLWRTKVTTAAEAMRIVKSGDRVFIGSGASTPQALVDALCARSSSLSDVEVLHIMTLGPAPYATGAHRDAFRHAALFIGSNVREAVQKGEADYIPIHLSDVPRLFRTRQRHVDVALVSVSEPQPDGTCTLGPAVDIVRAAVEAADVVIAQVNPKMPRTTGDAIIPVDELDHLVPATAELPELTPPTIDDVARRIGAHIARLVEDGSTIQAGIGSIPDAALAALGAKRDLGIHTEMVSDGMMYLIEHGVVTNERKALDPGVTVTSFALGSRKLYEYVGENPKILFRSTEYTNDTAVIARQPKMVAINGAIEVDLTGQVCADSVGSTFYSGFGGQLDFIRGASRSPGGLPIIALPSTVRDGEISRIVPRLAQGAGVVTNRADVHYVITEYGVADLHGKSVRERTMELVQIAHPRFRPWLMREAKGLHFVYPDQTEPSPTGPAYPEQWESWAIARDGTHIFLRPVRPTDEDLVRDFFYHLSERTIYLRYAGIRKTMPHAERLRVVNVDYESEMTILAVVLEEGHERIVGMGSYVVDRAANEAETAFIVADGAQGKGIGSVLFRRLADIARTKGLRALVADVLPENVAMFRVLAKAGLPTEGSAQTGRVRVFLK